MQTRHLAATGHLVPSSTSRHEDQALNLGLLPLALSCRRSGREMSVARDCLHALLGTDLSAAAFLVEGLGIVGFYCPDQALDVLSIVIPHLTAPAIGEATASAIGCVALAHPALTALFVDEYDCEHIQPLAHTKTSLLRLRPDVDRVGFLNNSVNQSLMHPIMRDRLVIPSYRILARAQSQRQYIAEYTPLALALLREHDFRLLDWWEDAGD